MAGVLPRSAATDSIGTPFSRSEIENVSRIMCGWPSTPASFRSFLKLLCQSATADFGRPLPDQKKYFSPTAGHCSSASRTNGGRGKSTGTPVFCVRKNNFPFFSADRLRQTNVANPEAGVSQEKHERPHPRLVSFPVDSIRRIKLTGPQNFFHFFGGEWHRGFLDDPRAFQSVGDILAPARLFAETPE